MPEPRSPAEPPTWRDRLRARGRALAAADPLSALVLALATLALAMPLATVEWLPFVDHPQHLGAIAAIHGQGHPHFDRFFVVDYARSQYLLLYVLGAWLADVLGVEGAGRATVILSVASLPLAVALYLRAHGRPAIGAAIAAPVAMHTYVFWGFSNYAAGMVLALLALAAAAGVARRPDLRRGAVLAIAALLTFYAHAQLHAWMGLACIVQLAAMAPALGRRRTLRALGISALAALPSLLAALAWLRASGVLERGEAGARSGHAAQIAAEGAAPVFVPVAETVRGWLSHSFDVYRDGAGANVAAAFLAAIAVLVVLRSGAARPLQPNAAQPASAGRGWRGILEAAPDRPLPPSLAPEMVLLLTFALYLFAPFSYRLIEPINHRFLPLALALLPVLGPRAAPRRPARLAIAAVAVGLAFGTAHVHAARFAQTDREMGELAAALARTQPGRRLLGLIHDPHSQTVALPIYLHAHQYYQARVGGLACFSFVEFPKSPVQYAPGAAPPPFPPRFEWTPARYDHRIWGDAFDYWLVRHEPGRAPPRIFRAPAPSGAPTPEPIFEGERWTLYAVPREGTRDDGGPDGQRRSVVHPAR